MIRTFTTEEKNAVAEQAINAYKVGNANNLLTVYYVNIDSFDNLNDGRAYFTNRFEMDNFVTGLENRFNKWEQKYYILFDGDFKCNI